MLKATVLGIQSRYDTVMEWIAGLRSAKFLIVKL